MSLQGERITARSGLAAAAARIPWAVVVLALVVLGYLGVIWVYRYIPTQDGPSHLANACMLRDLLAPGKAPGEEPFYIVKKPFPNWGYYAALGALTSFLKPLVAEKVFLSLYIGGVAASVYGFARSTSRPPAAAAAAAAALPFALGVPFHMGFFNYIAGVVIYFGALGYVWGRRARVGWKQMGILNGLAVVAYFFHLVPALLLVGSCHLLLIFVRGGWGRRIQAQLGLLPGWVLPAYYIASRWGGERAWLPRGDLAKSLFSGWPLVSLGAWQRPWGYVGVGLAVAATLLALGAFLKRKRIAGGDVYGLLLAIALGFYFLLPDATSDGSMISARLATFPFIFAFLWAAPSLGRRAAGVALGVAVIFAVVYGAGLAGFYYSFDREMRDFESGYCAARAGRTLVYFDRYPYAAGEIKRYSHLDGYYQLSAGVVSFSNYEADNAGFPVNFRSGEGRPNILDLKDTASYDVKKFAPAVDYVAVWGGSPFDNFSSRLRGHYGLLVAKGDFRLYSVKNKYRLSSLPN